MNKLFFADAVIVDIDESKNVVLYIEAFKAFRGETEGTEVKVVLKGRGKTVYDAFIDASLSASDEINVSQIKALIFTPKAAEFGLDNFIDAFDRSQKPTARTYLFIFADKNPDILINSKIKDEQFLGLFLDNLMTAEGKLSKIHRIRLNEFLNERMLGSKVSAIPILSVCDEQPNRIEVDGAAIVQNDKMVDTLSQEEVVPYNYVAHSGTYGVLLADNPNVEGGRVSLKVLKTKTKVDIKYDGNYIWVYKKVRLTTTIVEAQKKINLLNDNVREEIEKTASNNLKRECINLFQEYQGRGIDIYNISREFQLKYPDVKIENMLDKTKLAETDIKVNIEGSNNTTNFD
jgi:Ger(x)C family germination protein